MFTEIKRSKQAATARLMQSGLAAFHWGVGLLSDL
jgi:hypothetical protein